MLDPPSNHVTCQVPDPLRRADLLAVRPFGVAFFSHFVWPLARWIHNSFYRTPVQVAPRGSSCVCGSLGSLDSLGSLKVP